MQKFFDVITQARKLLAEIPAQKVSEGTAQRYREQMKRICGIASSTDEIVAISSDTTKVNTWYCRKAAVKFCARNVVDRLLREQDRLQRNLKGGTGEADLEHWTKVVSDLSRWSKLLSTVTQATPIPNSLRKPRHSKRSDMKGLPVDWRERLILRMPNYHPIVLTAAVCGCRPEELVSGVVLTIESGLLIALIRGAKCTERSGQPWRRLTWSVHDESNLVQFLIKEVARVGGEVRVELKDAKRFSGAVRAAARREWPERVKAITPYCFRHAFASDAKASGTSGDDLSRMLGHCVDVTKSSYGHAKMGRSKGVSPMKVEADRAVKKSAGLRQWDVAKKVCRKEGRE